jgi:RNA polymerase sigma-70 factor (ECF subfamily)
MRAVLHVRARVAGTMVALAIGSGLQARWMTNRWPVEPGRTRGARALDRELIERARGGDEAAFAELAARVGDRMFATAQHILHDTGRAEDAAQRALITIWRELPYLADPDRFQAWAYRIVVRAAYREARNRRMWQLRSRVTPRPTHEPDPATAVADRDQLARGFHRLPMNHRAVLVLKHFSGLSNAEIAEALGIPEGTVRSRLHHGIRALRAALDADLRTPEREST